MRTSLLSLAVATCFLHVAPAQNCSDNQFPLTLVNSLGVPAPTATNPITNETYYVFTNDQVFLAFPPTVPSGTYYVHITDPLGGGDEVLSINDPLDRFVLVTNNGGVISLSLPFTTGQNPPVFGLGLGGVGQSILVAPFQSSIDEPCQFKAWFGDCWDLSAGPQNPYLLFGGFNPVTQSCCVRSYSGFVIGDGTASDVCGVVFLDSNRNGVRDPGEGGVGGLSVQLTGSGSPLSATTDGNGAYCFPDIAPGSYTATLVLGGAPYVVTTATSFVVEVSGCGNIVVPDFGVAPPLVAANGRTIGFWRNVHGRALVTQYGILATLPALCLVNGSGQYIAPANLTAWASFLQTANAVNMANMLSAQLAAMHCNVIVGFVSPNAVIHDAVLGNITIGNLMLQAVTSLCLHPYTPSGHPQRAAQEVLKTALDLANNNLNWL